MALVIGCMTTLLLGATGPARAGDSAARCAATLERLDARLDQCAARCIEGEGEVDDCALRCEEKFEARRDIALGGRACEALSDLMTMPAATQALRVGTGGSTGLWCACKLNCDNDYAGMPVLIRACKKLCDDQNKCRKDNSIGGGIIFIR
jgi:hypothetical protein